jgi:hypothetical protein
MVDDLVPLRTMMCFEDTVDLFANLQLGIKDRAAWNDFTADFSMECFMFLPGETRTSVVQPAQEERLGICRGGYSFVSAAPQSPSVYHS